MKTASVLLALLTMMPLPAAADATAAVVRVATYNVALAEAQPGGLVARLEAGDAAARRIAAVIQRVRPDLLLLNEFDFDPEGRALTLWRRDYLGVGQHGEAAIDYPHAFLAPVNTGVPSGQDLDGDGRTDGPGDAWGYGHHPGQYGMLVLSRFPIAADSVRSFREFRWAALPGARRPFDPVAGTPFNADPLWQQLRLSSKAHWDVPVATPLGTLHFLVAHPTPPVFDGPERRNALRNFDELRLWAEYLAVPSRSWLVDDDGHRGGLPAAARFVLAGDLNADPADGASLPGAVQQLLEHPRVLPHPAPRSEGARLAGASGEANRAQRSDRATDTGAFGARTGNMRVDYVLPSTGFEVVASGVFWPPPDTPEAEWITASDHRLVWVDLRLRPPD